MFILHELNKKEGLIDPLFSSINLSPNKIAKVVFDNCSYKVLLKLKLSGQREVNIILIEFGLGITKEEESIDLNEYATKEKFSPLAQ